MSAVAQEPPNEKGEIMASGPDASDLSPGDAPSLRYWLVAMICCAGVACSLAVSFAVRRTARREMEAEFCRAAELRVAACRERADDIDMVLSAIQAFQNARGRTTEVVFSRFVAPFLGHLGRIRGLQWAPRVAGTERAMFEAAARQQGFTGFQIVETGPDGKMTPAAERDEYFPVYCRSPVRGSEHMLGFDLASDPARRAGLERARDSGRPVATEPTELIGESGDADGFVVFQAVYAGDKPPRPSKGGGNSCGASPWQCCGHRI